MAFQLAKKLAALRKQGVLIIGSGNIVHNLRAISWEHIDQIGAGYDWAFAFRETVNQAIAKQDDETLVHYEQLGEKPSFLCQRQIIICRYFTLWRYANRKTKLRFSMII